MQKIELKPCDADASENTYYNEKSLYDFIIRNFKPEVYAYHVVQLLRGATAADVAPVVRCRDCRFRPSIEHSKLGGRVLIFPGPSENPCPCQNLDDDWYSYNPDDEFFCAFGAKMDEEAENDKENL